MKPLISFRARRLCALLVTALLSAGTLAAPAALASDNHTFRVGPRSTIVKSRRAPPRVQLAAPSVDSGASADAAAHPIKSRCYVRDRVGPRKTIRRCR